MKVDPVQNNASRVTDRRIGDLPGRERCMAPAVLSATGPVVTH